MDISPKSFHLTGFKLTIVKNDLILKMVPENGNKAFHKFSKI